jgi:phosphoglycolate phosphatase
MSYKNIIFDLDGTLVDSFVGVTKSIQHALSNFDVKVPRLEDLGWCIGPPLSHSFKKLLNTEDQSIIKKALVLYREYYQDHAISHHSLYDNAEFILKSIKKENGFKLFILTGKLEKFAESVLKNFKLDNLFAGIHGAIMDKRFVKHETLEKMIKYYNLKKEQTIIIGDTNYDIIAGQKSNIATIAVGHGYGDNQELKNLSPDYFCDDLSGVLSILKI